MIVFRLFSVDIWLKMKIIHILDMDQFNSVLKCITLIILLSSSLTITGCGQRKEPQSPLSGYITVKGSDQALPAMMEAAYSFMDLYQKAKILVVGGGSNVGLAAIFIDSAQIAVSTRPMTPEEKKRAEDAGFKIGEFMIAKDGIAIVVNPLNPVEKLTVNQIVDIFTGKIKNWSKVGGKNWPIRVLIWGENSGTHSYFKDSILLGKDYIDNALRFEYTETLAKQIAEDKGSIGAVSAARIYRSWSPLVEDVRMKALAVSREAKGSYILPDEATVHGGEYPFVRHIYLYTPQPAKNLDAGFVSYLTSSAGQKILAANGFVPITVPVKYKRDTL